MLKRLSEYLGAKPKRAAMIVMILVVVLILVVASSLFQLLNLGSYFETPYPSEDTPLTTTDMGVEWTQPLDPYPPFIEGWNYTDLWVYWCDGPAAGRISLSMGQDYLDNGYPASTEWLCWISGSLTHVEYEFRVNVTDAVGDGSFGEGDKIVLKAVPEQASYWQEDNIYVIAVAYVGEPCQGSLGAYNLAFHNDEFYSWANHELSVNSPWWEQW